MFRALDSVVEPVQVVHKAFTEPQEDYDPFKSKGHNIAVNLFRAIVKPKDDVHQTESQKKLYQGGLFLMEQVVHFICPQHAFPPNELQEGMEKTIQTLRQERQSPGVVLAIGLLMRVGAMLVPSDLKYDE